MRNAIERLKDFRRIATRYDCLATDYFTAICLVEQALAVGASSVAPTEIDASSARKAAMALLVVGRSPPQELSAGRRDVVRLARRPSPCRASML